jgi:hypothetical protein
MIKKIKLRYTLYFQGRKYIEILKTGINEFHKVFKDVFEVRNTKYWVERLKKLSLLGRLLGAYSRVW